MQFRKQTHNYIALVSAIAVFAALGLSAGPGFAQDKNPHAWGLAASTVAAAQAAQSGKNPHAWGLTSPTVASRASNRQ